MAVRPPEPKPLLKFIGPADRHIGGRGMIGIFTGHEKSGKSFVASCIAASGLKGGREVLNFSLDLDGGKMLWFDTEQSGFFFHKTQERIHRMAGQPGNTGYYDAFHLRKMSAAERLEVVEHFIYNTPALSVVMIDGFVDLMKDYNDLEAVQEYVGRLMKWSDERQVLIMGVLHVNKGDGKIRGHIGSELKNKCDFIINTAREESQFTISNPTSRYLLFRIWTLPAMRKGCRFTILFLIVRFSAGPRHRFPRHRTIKTRNLSPCPGRNSRKICHFEL